MSHKHIIRPISAVLITAFLFQDILWANPEILQNNSASAALQVPSMFQFVNTKTYENTLEGICVALIKSFPDIGKFNYRIAPNIRGSNFELDFNQKRSENDLIIVPCSITTNRGCRLYEAVINLQDKSVSIEKPQSAPRHREEPGAKPQGDETISNNTENPQPPLADKIAELKERWRSDLPQEPLLEENTNASIKAESYLKYFYKLIEVIANMARINVVILKGDSQYKDRLHQWFGHVIVGQLNALLNTLLYTIDSKDRLKKINRIKEALESLADRFNVVKDMSELNPSVYAKHSTHSGTDDDPVLYPELAAYFIKRVFVEDPNALYNWFIFRECVARMKSALDKMGEAINEIINDYTKCVTTNVIKKEMPPAGPKFAPSSHLSADGPVGMWRMILKTFVSPWLVPAVNRGEREPESEAISTDKNWFARHAALTGLVVAFAADIITKLLFTMTLSVPSEAYQEQTMPSENIFLLLRFYKTFFEALFSNGFYLSLNRHYADPSFRIFAGEFLVLSIWFVYKKGVEKILPGNTSPLKRLLLGLGFGGALGNSTQVVAIGYVTNWWGGPMCIMNLGDFFIFFAMIPDLLILSVSLIGAAAYRATKDNLTFLKSLVRPYSNPALTKFFTDFFVANSGLPDQQKIEELTQKKEVSNNPTSASAHTKTSDGLSRRDVLKGILATAGINWLANNLRAQEAGLNVGVSGKIDDRTGGKYQDILNEVKSILRAVALRMKTHYYKIDEKGIVLSVRDDKSLSVSIKMIDRDPDDRGPREVVFTSADLNNVKARSNKIGELKDAICGMNHSALEDTKLEWIGYLSYLLLPFIGLVVIIATYFTMRSRQVTYWRNKRSRDTVTADHDYQASSALRHAGHSPKKGQKRRGIFAPFDRNDISPEAGGMSSKPNGDDLVGEAKNALKDGDLAIAKAKAKEATQKNPGDPRAWNMLAQTLLKDRKLTEAIAVLSDDNGSSFKPLFQNDDVSHDILANILDFAGRYDDAIKILSPDRGRSLKPLLENNIYSHCTLAKILIHTGRCDDAINILCVKDSCNLKPLLRDDAVARMLFDKAILKSRKAQLAHLQRVNEAYRLIKESEEEQDMEKAITKAQEAAWLSPETPRVWDTLARKLLKAKRFKEAIAAISNDGGVSFKPLLKDNPFSHNILADILDKMGRYYDSIDVLCVMGWTDLKPLLVNDPYSHCALAKILLHIKKYDDAIHVLCVTDGFDLKPLLKDNELARRLLAMAASCLIESSIEALRDGRVEDVIANAGIATKVSPENVRGWSTLASGLLRAGKFNETVAVLSDDNGRTLKSFLKGDISNFNALATALKCLGRRDDAINILNYVNDDNPAIAKPISKNLLVSHVILCGLYVKAKSFSKAEGLIHKMLASFANYPDAYLTACRAYYNMADQERASQIIRDAHRRFPGDSRIIEQESWLLAQPVAISSAKESKPEQRSDKPFDYNEWLKKPAVPSQTSLTKKMVTRAGQDTVKNSDIKDPSRERGHTTTELINTYNVTKDNVILQKIQKRAKKNGDKEALTFLDSLGKGLGAPKILRKKSSNIDHPWPDKREHNLAMQNNNRNPDGPPWDNEETMPRPKPHEQVDTNAASAAAPTKPAGSAIRSYGEYDARGMALRIEQTEKENREEKENYRKIAENRLLPELHWQKKHWKELLGFYIFGGVAPVSLYISIAGFSFDIYLGLSYIGLSAGGSVVTFLFTQVIINIISHVRTRSLGDRLPPELFVRYPHNIFEDEKGYREKLKKLEEIDPRLESTKKLLQECRKSGIDPVLVFEKVVMGACAFYTEENKDSYTERASEYFKEILSEMQNLSVIAGRNKSAIFNELSGEKEFYEAIIILLWQIKYSSRIKSPLKKQEVALEFLRTAKRLIERHVNPGCLFCAGFIAANDMAEKTDHDLLLYIAPIEQLRLNLKDAGLAINDIWYVFNVGLDIVEKHSKDSGSFVRNLKILETGCRVWQERYGHLWSDRESYRNPHREFTNGTLAAVMENMPDAETGQIEALLRSVIWPYVVKWQGKKEKGIFRVYFRQCPFLVYQDVEGEEWVEAPVFGDSPPGAVVYEAPDQYALERITTFIKNIKKPSSNDKQIIKTSLEESLLSRILPADTIASLKNQNLLGDAGGLQPLIAILSKYSHEDLVKKGIKRLSEEISEDDIKKYSRVWTFDNKNENLDLSEGQWLIVETKNANFTRIGKSNKSGNDYLSISLDGGKTFFALIPPLESNNQYWLTFYWLGYGWEGKDYYLNVPAVSAKNTSSSNTASAAAKNVTVSLSPDDTSMSDAERLPPNLQIPSNGALICHDLYSDLEGYYCKIISAFEELISLMKSGKPFDLEKFETLQSAVKNTIPTILAKLPPEQRRMGDVMGHALTWPAIYFAQKVDTIALLLKGKSAGILQKREQIINGLIYRKKVTEMQFEIVKRLAGITTAKNAEVSETVSEAKIDLSQTAGEIKAADPVAPESIAQKDVRFTDKEEPNSQGKIYFKTPIDKFGQSKTTKATRELGMETAPGTMPSDAKVSDKGNSSVVNKLGAQFHEYPGPINEPVPGKSTPPASGAEENIETKNADDLSRREFIQKSGAFLAFALSKLYLPESVSPVNSLPGPIMGELSPVAELFRELGDEESAGAAESMYQEEILHLCQALGNIPGGETMAKLFAKLKNVDVVTNAISVAHTMRLIDPNENNVISETMASDIDSSDLYMQDYGSLSPEKLAINIIQTIPIRIEFVSNAYAYLPPDCSAIFDLKTALGSIRLGIADLARQFHISGRDDLLQELRKWQAFCSRPSAKIDHNTVADEKKETTPATNTNDETSRREAASSPSATSEVTAQTISHPGQETVTDNPNPGPDGMPNDTNPIIPRPKPELPEQVNVSAARIQELIRNLQNLSIAIRMSAAHDLGEAGIARDDVIGELCNVMRRKDGDFDYTETPAGEAFQSLIKIGPATIPHLIWHLADETNPDRKPFAIALGRFGEKAQGAAPVLIKILDTCYTNESYVEYRHTIVKSLISVGKGYPDTIPALKKVILTEPDMDVRATAISGAGKILGAKSAAFFADIDQNPRNRHPDPSKYIDAIALSGVEAIPELLKIENGRDKFIHGCVAFITETHAREILSHLNEKPFDPNDLYAIALQHLLDWPGDLLRDRWEDLRTLYRIGFEPVILLRELRKLRIEFGRNEPSVWTGYLRFIQTINPDALGNYSDAIRALSTHIVNSDDLLRFGADLIDMDRAVSSEATSAIKNGSITDIISKIESDLHFPRPCSWREFVERRAAFIKEWLHAVEIIKSMGDYHSYVTRKGCLQDIILTLEPSRIKEAISKLNVFFMQWRMINEISSPTQQCSERDFKNDYLPLILILELILPGSMGHLSGLLEKSQSPKLIERYMSAKRAALTSSDIMSAIARFFKRLDEAYRIKYKPDISSFSKMFYFAGILREIGNGAEVSHVFDSYDIGKIESKDAIDIPHLLTELLIQKINSHFYDSMEIDRESMDSASSPPVWKIFYTPFFPRIIQAYRDIKYASSEKAAYFKGLVISTIGGRFWDYIENVKQEDFRGEEIALHNRNVRHEMRRNGIKARRWLGKLPADRMHPGHFEYQKGSDKIDDNAASICDVIDYIQRTLSLEIAPEDITGISKILKEAGIEMIGEKNNPILVINRESETKHAATTIGAVSNSLALLNSAVGELINKLHSQEHTPPHVIETANHLRERIELALARQTISSAEEKEKNDKIRSFIIRPILRNPGHDLFLGDLTSCCLAMNSTHPQAMLERLIDEGINVIEAIDRNTGLTMAAAWLFLAEDGSLVIQNLEINASYEVDPLLKDSVGQEMIKYAARFAEYIGSRRLYIGQPGHGKYFGSNGLIKREYGNREVRFGLEKIGGYLGEKYYLDSAGRSNAYIAWQKWEPKAKETLNITPLAKPLLRDLRDPKLAVQNMIETIISILISRRETEENVPGENAKVSENKLVLAFHSKLKGYDLKRVQVLIRQLNKLKEKEGFKQLLQNLTIIQSFDDETSLQAELVRNSIDPNERNTAAFLFAPAAEQKNLPNSNPNMHQVFINENEEFFDTTKLYYPLFEIVVMTLVKYHTNYSREEMRAAFPLGEINIDLVDDDNAFLVFSLLPRIKRYNADTERVERYTLINKWIKSAA